MEGSSGTTVSPLVGLLPLGTVPSSGWSVEDQTFSCMTSKASNDHSMNVPATEPLLSIHYTPTTPKYNESTLLTHLAYTYYNHDSLSPLTPPDTPRCTLELHPTLKEEAAPLILEPTLAPVSLMTVPVRFSAEEVFSPTDFKVSFSL